MFHPVQPKAKPVADTSEQVMTGNVTLVQRSRDAGQREAVPSAWGLCGPPWGTSEEPHEVQAEPSAG